jgi:hypothetical protein
MQFVYEVIPCLALHEAAAASSTPAASLATVQNASYLSTDWAHDDLLAVWYCSFAVVCCCCAVLQTKSLATTTLEGQKV